MMVPQYVAIDHPWYGNEDMPIYRWVFPVGATDEELDECLRAREVWGEKANYYVSWVIDLSAIAKAPAKQRKMFGEHLKRFEPHNIQWNTGSAIIVPNAWLRGLVTAVFWISPPKFPTKLFSEPSEAEKWAKSQLADKLGATVTSARTG